MVGDGRVALQRLIEERGEDYAGLSRLLGRNPAYVQQFIKRGTPRRLAEDDRRLLARYFGVGEALLGGLVAEPAPVSTLVPVPRLDVGASAGAGAYDGDERGEAHIAFDPAWLRRVARGAPDQLSIIRVSGDSMAPSLGDGDDILVDRGDGAERVRDGIYVLRIDDALVVKRLAVNPAARTLSVRSDNPAYPGWPDCDPAAVDIVGRVVWTGRRVG
jgi:Peptidase S24-like